MSRFARVGHIVLFTLLTVSAYGLSDRAVLDAMSTELNRSLETLSKQEHPLYYLSYEITETHERSMSAERGSIQAINANTASLLDMDLRIGNAKFDNTHVLASDSVGPSVRSMSFAIPTGDAKALQQELWYATDRLYKTEAQKYENLQNALLLESTQNDTESDFSSNSPQASIERDLKLKWNENKWRGILTDVSAIFKDQPARIYAGTATLAGRVVNTFYVNSEGSSIKQSHSLYTLSMRISGQNGDGERMNRSIQFSAHTLANLPTKKQLTESAAQLKEELLALLTAPLVDPYTGPAILSGRASGVFFHEILGHRLEGHRLKLKRDAQTFKEKINQQILPTTFNVYFDPTLTELEGIDLIGTYRYDNEGVKARRVSIIENGVLKRFLMSRSPLAEFPNSNGHGRKQTGFKSVSRQSNMIIDVRDRVSMDRLKEMLLEEVRVQGKDFGLLFDDIQGGYTFTGRSRPNAFNVTPTIVYKIHPDGSEELVRGVDLIGTPLTAFSRIVAASQEIDVFNGWCGAESGNVPVAAVSPAILVRQVEVQKKAVNEGRLPLLAPPQHTLSF